MPRSGPETCSVANTSWSVIVSGTDHKAGEEVARSITGAPRGSRASIFIRGSLADEGSVRALHEAAAAAWGGRIDAAVNVPVDLSDEDQDVRLADLDPAVFGRAMSGCALPTFISMQAQIRHMLPLSEGRIVNIASASPPNILDEGGADASARYAVSNPELLFILSYSPSRWFQAADVSDGILINAVVPACLSQRFMQEALSPGWLGTGTAFAGGKPPSTRQAGDLDFARSVAYLLGCQNAFGQIVTVDGGQ
ncbi:hypothetical protein GGTG_05388 [Gaeumannomyces tritici R3-111a-1]|uniref:Uncharacterized protein n=1 Tax=Gaeumannomyces tritici (strain R3-111a-1) TaxID=644352 RepID=J3NVS5_GAET3|nr:hypothetical protein GGTG_05388 [Gaeumannomyces tritici R3-111a-1]EJT75454.1 hypothetical protein GGTG_05388 [Gaeumannomyces tritici R3-111a-1]